jgi:PIN domain nuclease of toxin-antitoxin system
LNLLLDTHIALWWFDDSPRLHRNTRTAINGADRVAVSIASAWEYAIKAALGRLRLPEPFFHALERSGFEPLPIGFMHTEHLVTMPHHHGDPFDRMLIAQAVVEGLTIVTHDRHFETYGVKILWA